MLPLPRICYATYGICIGIQAYILGGFIPGLFPLPEALQASASFAIVIGTFTILSSIGMILSFKTQLSAFFMATFYFVVFLVLHVPRLISNIRNGSEWTVLAEMLALCAGGLTVVAAGPADVALFSSVTMRSAILAIARYFFIFCLFVFAGLHFVYADFIAFLIPGWIPFHLFWAYFVGVAFLATAISMIVNVKDALALNLLGIMFLFWVVALHTPRVIANLHHRDEWSSAVIALSMSGICFMLARKKA